MYIEISDLLLIISLLITRIAYLRLNLTYKTLRGARSKKTDLHDISSTESRGGALTIHQQFLWTLTHNVIDFYQHVLLAALRKKNVSSEAHGILRKFTIQWTSTLQRAILGFRQSGDSRNGAEISITKGI